MALICLKIPYLNLFQKIPKSFLEIIKTAGTRLSNLVEALLSYSREQRHESNSEFIELNQVVADVLSAFDDTITEDNIAFHYDDLPRIYADLSDIKRVLYILIDNAIKYRKPGVDGHYVSIKHTRLKAGDDGQAMKQDKLCLTVTDNGIGFDNKHVSDIFKPLKRLVPRERYEGAGVGLAIAKKIVSRYAGTIEATGEKGNGASFNITLSVPIYDSDSSHI